MTLKCGVVTSLLDRVGLLVHPVNPVPDAASIVGLVEQLEAGACTQSNVDTLTISGCFDLFERENL